MSTVQNASELLALLCVAGLGAALFRWRRAVRRDFLLAFILFLLGALGREVIVWAYGITGWPLTASHWSAAARGLQIVGAVLFVRVSLRDVCGEWGWILVVVAASVGAAFI